MASTLVYAHAPSPTLNDLDSVSWAIPSFELSQLWQMSQSLPKGDQEITPVQAWFLLDACYDMKTLIGDGGAKLDELKRGLAELVNCFHFGAIMDESQFWKLTSQVMDDQPA